MAGFGLRGVVEGFYGTPWSPEERLALLERMGAWGMNRYLYAPKDDPLHRERWREPYPAETCAQFRTLVERGRQVGVGVGFALSPGLSIRYASKSDRDALAGKLARFVELGARTLSLALDDVPSRLAHDEDRRSFASLGQAHVALVEHVLEGLADDVELWVVPNDYLGVSATDYLTELGRALPARVEIAWTGRTVLSPTVASAEAAERAETLRRKPLLWDNVPVADGPMRVMLHLAPYLGRAADLCDHLSGVLLNPMEHPRASRVTLQSAAAYLNEPRRTDPERAWRAAVEEAGAGDPQAFALFAAAHRFSPVSASDRERDPELDGAFAELCARLEAGQDVTAALDALSAAVAARREVAARLRERLLDRALLREIEPWIDVHAAQTERIAFALDALAVLLGAGERRDRLLAYVRLEGRLTRVAPGARASYGPRRVLYPQLASMRDDRMGFGADPSLLRGRCLADEIVDFVADLALWMLSDEPR
jgi:hyaluronoglucosaminidase